MARWVVVLLDNALGIAEDVLLVFDHRIRRQAPGADTQTHAAAGSVEADPGALGAFDLGVKGDIVREDVVVMCLARRPVQIGYRVTNQSNSSWSWAMHRVRL